MGEPLGGRCEEGEGGILERRDDVLFWGDGGGSTGGQRRDISDYD